MYSKNERNRAKASARMFPSRAKINQASMDGIQARNFDASADDALSVPSSKTELIRDSGPSRRPNNTAAFAKISRSRPFVAKSRPAIQRLPTKVRGPDGSDALLGGPDCHRGGRGHFLLAHFDSLTELADGAQHGGLVEAQSRASRAQDGRCRRHGWLWARAIVFFRRLRPADEQCKGERQRAGGMDEMEGVARRAVPRAPATNGGRWAPAYGVRC